MVRPTHPLYRPHGFRPLPAVQNPFVQQVLSAQYRPISQPIAVNYSDFLAHNHYKSNHIDHQPQQIVHHTYHDESDPVILQQVHGGPNSQQQKVQQLQPSSYEGFGLQNDYVDVQAAPGDSKYYQYESFDPNTQRRRRSDGGGVSASGMSVQDKRIAGVNSYVYFVNPYHYVSLRLVSNALHLLQTPCCGQNGLANP